MVGSIISTTERERERERERKLKKINSLSMEGPYFRRKVFTAFRIRFFTSELLGVRACSLAVPEK
jgi:hypothetical protein